MTMNEAWFYDAASRTLYDENRLAVARDVGHDDAQTILKALGCEVDFSIVGELQPNPLFVILAELLAYEDQAFEDDEEVDGGDLVEFWADRRQQLRSALAYCRPPTLTALAREAATLFREYEAHHRAKASEAGRPEKAERNADIALRLESALIGGEAAKRQLFIAMERGNITSIWSPNSMSDVSYTTIDYDTDGAKRDEVEMVSDGVGHLESAHVRRDQEISLGDAPKFFDAQTEDHDAYFGDA